MGGGWGRPGPHHVAYLGEMLPSTSCPFSPLSTPPGTSKVLMRRAQGFSQADLRPKPQCEL